MKNFIEVGKTEEEQIATIKSWLSENLLHIVVAIALGVGGLSGWNYYKSHQTTQAEQARGLYLNISQNQDSVSNQNNLEKLISSHSDSIYLAQSKLLLAKYAAKTDNFKQAESLLKPLINNKNKIVSAVATLHLSEIYIQQSRHNESITLLTEKNQSIELKDNSYFKALKQHALGDIYILQGNNNLAKEQYTLASQQPGVSASELGKILSIKLNNL